ncbi:MAG: hypothetical protein D6807_06900 [Alphaproteobacteria bacterium]|nr:MAG: hypothetical protein D6807_06900 [Alphaproteobacteria bacterium]
MQGSLIFRAGERAAAIIRREGGLDPNRIRLLIGASGGPKWLALRHLDEAILDCWLAGHTGPLDLVASSIGCWRFACYAQADPLAALTRFEEAYLAYRYEPGQGPREIMADSYTILDALLGAHGADEILTGPMRLHVMTARGRHLLARERGVGLALGLAGAALANLVDRRGLSLFVERTLFADPRSSAGFARWDGIPCRTVPLTRDNLRAAIMASSSIPVLLPGIADPAGAPPGRYWDGGITDYHFDLPVLEDETEAIALFPHFTDRIVPGWFDKPLRWRHRTRPADRLLMIAPSPDFIARLPHGKIPDRKDFRRFSEDERVAYWRHALAECARLADEFREVMAKGLLPGRLAPLPAS